MTRCLSSIFTHFSGSFQYSFSPYSAFNKPFFSSDNILDFFTIHSQNSRISRRIPVRFEESKTTKYLLFCSSFSLSPYSCGNLLPFQHGIFIMSCIQQYLWRFQFFPCILYPIRYQIIQFFFPPLQYFYNKEVLNIYGCSANLSGYMPYSCFFP